MITKGHRRPRIAILTNYPADYCSFTGGVETATAGLLEGLRAHQEAFELHVIAFAQMATATRSEQRDGFFFHFLGLPQRPYLRPRLPFRVFLAYRELARIRPDLIHCQDNAPMALASIFWGGRRVFTVHGVKRHEAAKRTGWERWSATFDAFLEPYIHGHFDNFICISNYVHQLISSKKRCFLIPNPVRSACFDARRTVDPAAPLLLFVGGLSPLKRPLDLLMAHHELRKEFPSLTTVLCGEPDDAGYIEKIRALATDGVFLPGRVGLVEILSWLSKATAFVLPSAQENSPIVIAEAMAAGVPVVATRVGGVPDLVGEEETGYLYEPGDIQALVGCLARLLAKPELVADLGDRGRAKALARYRPLAVARETAAVYSALL
jgi:glycosyltransferase involved in cell wall biosynthesis